MNIRLKADRRELTLCLDSGIWRIAGFGQCENNTR